VRQKYCGAYVDIRREITGRWRNERKEELHNSYSSPNIIIIALNIMMWLAHAEPSS
jgi:hypothetical protein